MPYQNVPNEARSWIHGLDSKNYIWTSGLFRLLRLTLLLIVDFCGPKRLRANRRDRLFELIRRLRGLRYRVLDKLLSSRRGALAQRDRAISTLRSSSVDGSDRFKAGTAESGAHSVDRHLALDLADLRVGVFIPSFLRGQGGAEKVAGQLANVISQAGCKIDLLCREADARAPAYSVEDDVRIRSLNELDDSQIERLRHERYDVIVCFGMAHFYRRIPYIAQILETPFIIQECTNPNHMTRLLHKLADSRSKNDAYWLRQAVFAHAAAVRFTNRHYQTTVVDQVKPFTYAFYNAFSLPDGWKYESNERPARKIICVGALKNKNKNGIAALIAFCNFAKRHGDWSLVFHGENNYGDDVARILRSNAHASVVDLGVIRGVQTIYSDAHALIIPSFEEGLPNVVVEAFSFGVPCIGFSDCEAVAHLIRHGETGLLVDRSDPNGLERALVEIANSDVRQRLSEGARAFAREHFDIDLWRQNWLHLLVNAVNGLNNEGRKQDPPAFVEDDEAALHWSRLLESFRAVA